MWQCETCWEKNETEGNDCWNCGTSYYSQLGNSSLWASSSSDVHESQVIELHLQAVNPIGIHQPQANQEVYLLEQERPKSKSTSSIKLTEYEKHKRTQKDQSGEFNFLSWSVKIAQLGEFPIYLHITFILLPILSLLRIASPEFLLFLSLSILIHELAHAIVCRLVGFGSGSITLWLFGGFFIPFELDRLPTQMDQDERLKYVAMIFAGPLSNFALSFLGFLIALFEPSESLRSFIEFNLLIAIFNLIPMPPLDGEKILVTLGLSYFTRQRIHQMLAVGLCGISIIGCYGIFYIQTMPDGVATWVGYIFSSGIHAWYLSKKTDDEIQKEHRKALEKIHKKH